MRKRHAYIGYRQFWRWQTVVTHQRSVPIDHAACDNVFAGLNAESESLFDSKKIKFYASGNRKTANSVNKRG
jgi:hypothetical protein